MPGEFAVPFAGSTRIIASRGRTGVTGNIYAGLHEFYDMAFVAHALRPGDLFADIGANVGSYTLLASGIAGAETTAFEPVPEAADNFMRNVRYNGLERLVRLRRSAVGATLGSLSFTAGLDTTNHVVNSSEINSQTIAVPVETLDTVFSARRPFLFKMDIEGFEEEALKGATGVLNDTSLAAMIIELNGQGRNYGSSDETVRRIVTSAGFQRYAYDPFTRRLSPWDRSMEPLRIGDNEIYVRDLDKIQNRVVSAAPITVLGHAI
jgi:FkbM family methyltransferase